MKHSVTIGVDFCFKGESFSPCITIDLDAHFQAQKDIGYIYDQLGKSIGLDVYRHEYDVMVMQDLRCKKAEGIAAQHVKDGQIDWQSLEEAWRQAFDLEMLKPIANKFFNVESLADEPKLAAALLAAYRAGQDKAVSVSKTNTGWNEVF
ncbi:MAG: hypothetical protein L3J61_01170 [Ghiorsea sp.]|nr:hypothetical protein [Ghiorsea sp.]